MDTDSMVGMATASLAKKYQLKDSLSWVTPNMPPDSDAETTYFLKDGDLQVRSNAEGIITSATFESRTDSPQQRMNSVNEAWSEYVRPRNEYLERNEQENKDVQ